MKDSTVIFLALIAAIAPTLTSILTWLSSRSALTTAARDRKVQAIKLEEVHINGNARLDTALASLKAVETEVRRLNVPGAAPTAPSPDVTISEQGDIAVEQQAPAKSGGKLTGSAVMLGEPDEGEAPVFK